MTNSIAAKDELAAFFERVGSIEADQKALADDKKELYAEYKARGFDTKALRFLNAERKRNSDEVAEQEAIRDLYREAMGWAYELRNTGVSDEDGDDSSEMV